MMGRLNHDQEQLFYSFQLDEAVPDDHLVRQIAAVLDLSWVHSELAPFYPNRSALDRHRAAALFVPASSPVPRRVHLQGHVSCMASSARYLKFSCQRRGRCFSQRTIVLTT